MNFAIIVTDKSFFALPISFKTKVYPIDKSPKGRAALLKILSKFSILIGTATSEKFIKAPKIQEIIKGFLIIDLIKYIKSILLLFEYKAKIVIQKTFKIGIAKVMIIADKTKPFEPNIEPLNAKNTYVLNLIPPCTIEVNELFCVGLSLLNIINISIVINIAKIETNIKVILFCSNLAFDRVYIKSAGIKI